MPRAGGGSDTRDGCGGGVACDSIAELELGMSTAPAQLKDVTVHSPKTRTHGVKALNVESRPWIDHVPVCPALNQYQIIHVGIMEAVAPTRIVRTKQTSTYFLAAFEGSGKVLVDGVWRRCGSG